MGRNTQVDRRGVVPRPLGCRYWRCPAIPYRPARPSFGALMVDDPGNPVDGSEPRGGEPRRAMPGLSLQRDLPSESLLAQLIGTLEIDTSTNCLMVNNGIMLVDVAWPPGWTIATRDNEIALIDAAGHTAGKLGDEVYVG